MGLDDQPQKTHMEDTFWCVFLEENQIQAIM